MPAPHLLRTPFVPHSNLLRSRSGPMERRWSVENMNMEGRMPLRVGNRVGQGNCYYFLFLQANIFVYRKKAVP